MLTYDSVGCSLSLVTKCYNLECGTLYLCVELLTLPATRISADVPLKLLLLTLDLLVGVRLVD